MSLNRPPAVEYFDRSGVIVNSSDASDPTEPLVYQTVFPRNTMRIGLMFQNQGANPMWLLITNPLSHRNTVVTIGTRFKLEPGESWQRDQFAPLQEIQIEGTDGDLFAAAEYGV